MPFTDFPNGLASAREYLDAQHHINTGLTGSVGDIGRFVISAEYDFSLREIICSLLAGRGLKLPNIQICLSLNLQELLGIPTLQSVLRDALSQLSNAMDRFLEHTGINQVLDRINNVLAEATNIANMINFCSAPIDPVAIPNMLEQSMQSFLGQGESLINRIGEMIPEQIGGCLIDGEFNRNVFRNGVLARISDNYDAVSLGTASDNFINGITVEIAGIVAAIDELIDRENSVSGTYSQGGSDFQDDREVNTTLGVMHNATEAGIQGNTQIASQLKALYDNLGSYQVVGNDGTVYNNIFETFVEPGLLDKLRYSTDPTPEISERIPVYNYCGQVTGYTTVESQSAGANSTGAVPGANTQPGFNAGGLSTDPASVVVNNNDSDSSDGNTGGNVTNVTNVTNINGSTLFAADEAGVVNSNATVGQMVYRTDTSQTYLRQTTTFSDIRDFVLVASESEETSAFITDLRTNTGTGIMVRNGDQALYRTLSGIVNQITVNNGNGTTAAPSIGLANNPVIPGAGAVVLPSGPTADRTNNVGAIRYNTTTQLFEVRLPAGWTNVATGSSGFITDASNIGTGAGVFAQENVNTLEFRSIVPGGGITVNQSTDQITISDQLTASNLSAGNAQVFNSRIGNNFGFRSITAGSGININSNDSTITISTATIEATEYQGTVTTTNATAAEVLFDGLRVGPGTGDAWFFEAQAIGKQTTAPGVVTSIKIEGILDNNAGVVSITGTTGNKTIYNSTPSTSAWDFTVDDSTNIARFLVQGVAATDIKWTVRVRFLAV